MDRCRRSRQMRDAGKAAIMIMTELELVAPVVIAFLVATLNLEWPQGRVGGPYMRFSTPTAPNLDPHPESRQWPSFT